MIKKAIHPEKICGMRIKSTITCTQRNTIKREKMGVEEEK